MDTNKKLKIMSEVVKPILNHIEKRMKNKMEALKAYDDSPISNLDTEIKRMREIEAMKLRTEINLLKDISDVIQDMFPKL
jgi:hypothetical protein